MTRPSENLANSTFPFNYGMGMGMGFENLNPNNGINNISFPPPSKTANM